MSSTFWDKIKKNNRPEISDFDTYTNKRERRERGAIIIVIGGTRCASRENPASRERRREKERGKCRRGFPGRGNRPVMAAMRTSATTPPTGTALRTEGTPPSPTMTTEKHAWTIIILIIIRVIFEAQTDTS